MNFQRNSYSKFFALQYKKEERNLFELILIDSNKDIFCRY